ncbi:DNA repair protein rad10 [Vittaforma corneae ATCC 50505]|uniref:DNA repair protein rad10 n=1 Tax=Vittaforma corneae (strain ATCC 50505) TaxID=993615 RepID=L2GQD7_VITCO|nr:DNA repair protein rad10 [Vittaforma corneae ATCC 50505]ELA42834.1 DNA repair protein rad10 [Vittaforma corneae ATCC 50505]
MIKIALLQRGNKLIEYLNAASWHFDASCSADYEINFSTLILFLSLKFHSAKPEYIYKRIAKLKEAKLRILLILIDAPNFNTSLQELFRTVPIIIVLCRTYEECSKYIKGFDLCSKRGVEILRNKDSTVDTFLQTFNKVNKTDAATLKRKFSTLLELFNAGEKDLANAVGIGKVKAQQLKKYLDRSFKR